MILFANLLRSLPRRRSTLQKRRAAAIAGQDTDVQRRHRDNPRSFPTHERKELSNDIAIPPE